MRAQAPVLPWVLALAGIAIVVAAWTYGEITSAGLRVLVPRPWFAVPLTAPLDVASSSALALGLLLYVAGLFAPARGR